MRQPGTQLNSQNSHHIVAGHVAFSLVWYCHIGRIIVPLTWPPFVFDLFTTDLAYQVE